MFQLLFLVLSYIWSNPINPSLTCTSALPLRQHCQDHLAEGLLLSTFALMASVVDVLAYFKSLLIGVLKRRAEQKTDEDILLATLYGFIDATQYGQLLPWLPVEMCSQISE